jgi:ferredoxin-NADP reductase
MPVYQLKLIERKVVALNTMEFLFEKPIGFIFKPGQYGGFTLINSPEIDAQGITRRFSLLSAPHDPHIAMTTRIQTSAYKRVLKDLPLGSEIKFAGPVGNFTLHTTPALPAIFIAGGIGITPFYSMIRDAIHSASTQQMLLFYGNQSYNDAAYLPELQQLNDENANFKLIPTLVNADPTWQGELGFISANMLQKYIDDSLAPIYYVCGTPAMVKAVQEMLYTLNIHEERIKIEDFPGY